MPDRPLVSIGIPTYNRASSLSRAINSALAQDYRNIELIISDNASTDETEAVCLEAKNRDSRVTYIRQKTNKGRTENFRQVLEHSTGEFFIWLADDDWLDDFYIARCVHVLLANPSHSLVCGRARYYASEQVVLEEPGINILQDSGRERVLDYYRQVGSNGTFHGVMRRKQLARVSFEDRLGEDWFLVSGIAFMGKIETLRDTWLHRSLQGASQDIRKHAVELGLTGIVSRYPHLNIATNAFKTIVWESPIYEGLTFFSRVRLGSRVFAKICRRCIVTKWHAQALDRINVSHPRFKRAAKFVKNKLRTSSQSV